jgi:hypothetical protein
MEAEAAFRVVDRPQDVTPSSKRLPHSLTSFSASSPAIEVEAAAGAAAVTTTTEGKEAAASRTRRAMRPAEGARRPPGSETGEERLRGA